MKLHSIAAFSSMAVIGAVVFAACGGDDSGLGNPPGQDGGPSACISPFTSCGGLCTNTGTDPGNCGTCGNTCDGTKGMVCSGGTCGLTCGGGATKCGTLCVDTQNDPKNCSACGMACSTGQVCSAGMCATACPAGQKLCSGTGQQDGGSGGAQVCVSTQTDPQNCGSCGNACPINNTCVAGACVATLANTSPVLVSTATCSTAMSYAGRKVAVDPTSNQLFVAMICGTGDVMVASSSSGGVTFGAPVDLKTTNTTEAAITLDSNGVVYVGTLSTAGALAIMSSTDHGATWSTSTPIESGLSTLEGLSLDTYKTTVYIAGRTTFAAATVHVWRSGASDAGSGYAMTNVPFPTTGINPFDVLVDQSSGSVWVVGDFNGKLYNAMSSDSGATFGAAVSPPGNVTFTDGALSSGVIFLAGNTDTLVEVKTSTPTMSSSIAGFGAGGAQERAIAADSTGNVFVVTGAGGLGGNLILQHVPSGGTAIDKSPVIAPGGSSPVVVSAGTNIAFAAYTSGGGVYARVVKF